MINYYLAIYGAAILTVLAQLILKSGAKKDESFLLSILNFQYVFGSLLFVFVIFLTLYGLQEVPLIYMIAVYPLIYVLVAISSCIFFNEKLNSRQIFSIFIIVLGILIFNYHF